MRAIALVLAMLGGLLVPAAVLAWDARDVLLDTDRWVETTAPVLEDDEAREAVSVLVVDRASARLACRGGLVGRLTTSRLGDVAKHRAAVELEQQLARERARDAWRAANRRGHEAFVRVARDGAEEGVARYAIDPARLVEVAAFAVDVLDDADDVGADACDGERGLAVLDAGAMERAADAAGVLHDAAWVPAVMLGLGLVLLAIAVWLGGLAPMLATWAAAGIAAALGAWWWLDAGIDQLVDGLGSATSRTLAEVVLAEAFVPVRERQLVLAWVLGGVLLGAIAVLVRRRSSRA